MSKSDTRVMASSMRRVRELEVWSQPGGEALSVDYGKDLQDEVWAAGVPQEVFAGISTIPDHTDVENLRLAIAAGEITEAAFIAFCKERGLPADATAAVSAARYLEHQRGHCVAWINLPEGADPAVLRHIATVVGRRGHVIVDPSTGETMTF